MPNKKQVTTKNVPPVHWQALTFLAPTPTKYGACLRGPLQGNELQPAGMAIVAGAIDFIARVFEFLAVGRQQFEIFTAALSENGVAGVAIVGINRVFAIDGFVVAIVASEAAWPIFVANIVGISFPAGLHFREEIVSVNLLHGFDGGSNSRITLVAIGENRGDAFESGCVVRICAGQREEGVGFDIRQ